MILVPSHQKVGSYATVETLEIPSLNHINMIHSFLNIESKTINSILCNERINYRCIVGS